jgi:signal recognition particle GTPase
MFDTLSDRLGGVFDRLRGRGALSEADVRGAMREVRIALLEADVALPVVRGQHHGKSRRPECPAIDHAGPAGRQNCQ